VNKKLYKPNKFNRYWIC